MSKLMVALLITGLGVAGCATQRDARMTSGAPAAPISKEAYDSAVRNAEAQYKINKDACDSRAGNAKDICLAEAKGKEKVAKAELDQKKNPSVRNERKVAEAKAEHKYHVAKEKCDMQKGKDEKACEKQVKAEYDKEKADIKKQFASRKDERPARSASTGVTK